jgi:RimJ/RimL family protein N-acetyltransferase
MNTALLETNRLILKPLEPADASEMVGVLSSSRLYEFTGGSPPSLPELEAQYRFQVAPRPDEEIWHNWIIQLAGQQVAVGFVQATVVGNEADIAWVVGVDWQRQGIATEAAISMRDWLLGQGAVHLSAHIHPKHLASERVAASIGLVRTEIIDDDGEVVWASQSE